jgi:inactivated superfamily I helicase
MTLETEVQPASFPSVTVLLRELVAHLREKRTQLRDEWARHLIEAQLLTAMTREEIFAEASAVYDSYLTVLETRKRRSPGSLRPQPLRAHHSPRRRDPRGARDRPAPA